MKTKITLFLCLLLSLGACNSWLDVDLADRVDEDKLFSKPEGFTEALAGVYSSMSKSALYGKVLSMELDVYTQLYVARDSYIPHSKYEYKNATVEAGHAAIWNNMYSCISGANNIIRWIEKNGAILTNHQRNQFKGEAVAMRAFLHFDLIRLFCPDVKLYPKESGIPYNKLFGVSKPPIYSVDECVQLVLNDLDEAETLLADDPINEVIPYQLSTENEGDKYVARFNLYAVKAMKARLYLARGDHQNAIKYAQEVIDSKKFQLLNFKDVDKANDTEIDVIFSDEHIFSLRNKEIPEISKALFVSNEETGTSIQAPVAFRNWSDLYESNNDDLRLEKWFSIGKKVVFSKYMKDNYELYFPKMPIIKLSEMYLILCESYYNTNREKSMEYINILRDHRIRMNSHWQFLTKEYIFNEIIRELVTEGQIWYAYKRWNRVIPSYSNITDDIQPNNTIFVFPMPPKELESRPELES